MKRASFQTSSNQCRTEGVLKVRPFSLWMFGCEIQSFTHGVKPCVVFRELEDVSLLIKDER